MNSSPIGIVPNRTFARGRRLGRPCGIRHCVGLWQQRRRDGEWRAGIRAPSAAHRTLPFGTMVQVTNKNNGRSITFASMIAGLSLSAG